MTGLFPLGVPSGPPLPPDDPVSVTVGHRVLSSRPQVIDDFSGSGFLPLLRMLARVRNLDGPDDIASGIPTAMSRAQAPYAEMGLLAAFFPLVAAAAVGAVRSARAGYTQDYPDSVRRTLDQQQRLIDALRHGNSVGNGAGAGVGESEATLQPLIDLHAQGVERFEARRRHRDKGLLSLLKHNLTSKRHHTPGNGVLSDAFNKRAADIIAERLARHWRLDTEETSYQSHLLQKCEGERQVAKRIRTVRLLTGIGMPGMAAGMVASMGKSAASAGAVAAQAAGSVSGQVAAEAAHHALGAATGGIMMGAQLAQGLSGVVSGRLHAAQHRQIRRDRDAVQAIAADLPERVPTLYARDARFLLADSARSQACDALLSAGQGLMLGAGVSTFACPPAALALAVPGIALTLGGSVGAGINEAHRDGYLGEQAPASMKAAMRLGNLGSRLREGTLGQVLREVADQFEGHQDRASLARRRRDPKSRDGETGLAPQEQWAGELRQHPASAAITALKSFRQEVFFATARDLARRRDPATQALFHDATGRRLKTLTDDERFARHLAADPQARAIQLRRHNEILARHLQAVDRFGRADSREALTDLAHVKRDRTARHGPTPPAMRAA
ncbi:hypothetical protein [Roseateles noduli]|uniref:hypothetical protein n=1 Tax=Roseateles noduli TaxID=2052484 RepID=UPI003D64D97E